MPVYVIGHKNPDTDAICSAIAYAWFLRQTSFPDAEAACCGEINARTQFVLNRAGLEPPRLIMDVRPTVAQICRTEIVSAQEDDSVLEVYQRMRERSLQTMLARDGHGKIAGLIPLFRLMELLLPGSRSLGDTRFVQTSLARISSVLQGRFLHAVEERREETLTLMVGAMKSESFARHAREFPPEHLLVVTGNRPTVQKVAIDYKVRALVITGGYDMDSDLLARAQSHGVNVISSPLDTATTTLLIRSAKVVAGAIERQFVSFTQSQLVSEAVRALRETTQNLFPVLAEDGGPVGVFTRADLLEVKPVKLVLVDHNELAQAVTGVEEAEILEVIDHHRLGGGLISREPIRFVNEPLGSTCTIVAKFLHHRNWTPTREIGACLAAGIISDTLNLTSPTTTPTDRAMLEWIASTCGLDVGKFAEEFFLAGSALRTHAPGDALEMDCKAYEENGWRFALAQIEENGLELFWQHKDKLAQALSAFVAREKIDFACLMITDITSHVSYLLTAGSDRVNAAVDYPRIESHLFELKGVVSRKKQLLPHLIRILSKLEK